MAKLRDASQRWLRPMAARIPLSPNALTVLACLISLSAALAFATARHETWRFGLGALLAAVGGILDLLDGVVARLKGLSSRFGDFLDHLLDRVSDLAMTAGWLLGTEVHPALALATVIAVAVNGYAGTQLEASFRVREYETTGRGEFFVAILALPLLAWWTGPGFFTAEAAGIRLVDGIAAVLLGAAVFGVAQRLVSARRAAGGAAPPVE